MTLPLAPLKSPSRRLGAKQCQSHIHFETEKAGKCIFFSLRAYIFAFLFVQVHKYLYKKRRRCVSADTISGLGKNSF